MIFQDWSVMLKQILLVTRTNENDLIIFERFQEGNWRVKGTVNLTFSFKKCNSAFTRLPVFNIVSAGKFVDVENLNNRNFSISLTS